MVPEQNIKPDTTQIRAFLDHLTRRWHELNQPVLLEIVFLTNEDRAKVKDVSRYPLTDLDDAVDHVAGMNPHKLNAYVTVNPVDGLNEPARGKRASAEHIVASFFHWADADSEEAANNIRDFVGPKCTMHVVTGRQPCLRPHVYWELEEPTYNLKAWEQTQRNIAARLKTDPAVVDPPRIMRIAGTINWPKPQKIEKGYTPEVTTLRIYDEDDRQPVSSERMARAFGSAESKSEEPKDWIDGEDFDRKTVSQYTDALRRARTDGEKHTGVRDLAASLAGAGVPEALAEAIIREACPVWDDNVEDLLSSAYRKFYRKPEFEIDGAAFESAPKIDTGLERFSQIEPSLGDSYLIKDFLAQGAMSVVYGPSNSGKTFFVIDLMFHIAAALKWRGRRVNQGAVLYLAAEGGRGIANRMFALRREKGHEDAPIYLRRAGLDLLKSEADLQHIYDLSADIHSAHPELPLVIVIDTLSRVMAGGDENGPVDMTQLIKNLDLIREKTGAHIMLVHHTGKDAAKGARGHSSLRAATDTEIEIEEPEEGDPVRFARDTKQREYASHRQFPFALKTVLLGYDQDGDEITTCVVDEADESEARKSRRKLTKNQQKVVDCFEMLIAEGFGKPTPGGAGMPETGKFTALEVSDLQEAFHGKYPGKNPHRAFAEAVDGLIAPGGLMQLSYGLIWRLDRQSNH